jgi:hypothetical protein
MLPNPDAAKEETFQPAASVDAGRLTAAGDPIRRNSLA